MLKEARGGEKEVRVVVEKEEGVKEEVVVRGAGVEEMFGRSCRRWGGRVGRGKRS